MTSVSVPTGISVVIPAYSRLGPLLAAIESVHTKYPLHTEIIVVDDASPRDLISAIPVCNSSGVPIRGFRFIHNRGPQAARNLGIRRARYSYISLLDSDDRFTLDKLERVRDILDHSDVDIVFHRVKGMDKYGNMAETWQRYLMPIVPFWFLLAFLNPIPTPALTFRRKLRLGPPGSRFCEDYGFLIRYCEPSTQITYINEELAEVGRHQGAVGGISSARFRMRLGEFAVKTLMLKDHRFPLVRYTIGTLCAILRLLRDVLTLRYHS